MTLWPISDKWPVEIMKAFYDKAMVVRHFQFDGFHSSSPMQQGNSGQSTAG